MNRRKWGRLLGVAAAAPELPLVQLHAKLDYLARAPMSGGVGTPGTAKSYHGHLHIDPPAGGFADQDVLWQFPHTLYFGTSAAVVVPDLSRNFAPGHYRISGWIQPPATTGLTGKGIMLRFFNAAPDLGWAIEGDAPAIGYIAGTGSGSPAQPVYFDTQFYMAGLWYVQVRAQGALTDTNLWSMQVDIAPMHLLDDYPSAR